MGRRIETQKRYIQSSYTQSCIIRTYYVYDSQRITRNQKKQKKVRNEIVYNTNRETMFARMARQPP